ncbi:MAG: hypothetical protein HGA85_08675, partial [Nanoarchaeota archaeon]|nr:hypothetical protein [Nanoarchaeota archaeon]
MKLQQAAGKRNLFMMKSVHKEILLLLFLVVISVAARVQFVKQTDFDSYWISGMAESITQYGYAKWIFHPASLFGYYPMSYPSALMFFLATFSGLTGLGMEQTILVTGMTLGVLGTFLVFLIGRKIAGFSVGYLAAFIFTLSPQIIYYSSYVASGRYFMIVFYLAFLIVLMRLLHYIGLGFDNDLAESELAGFRTEGLDIWNVIKYVIVAGLLFMFMFMIHRTAQLTLLFAASAVMTVAIYAAATVWDKARHMPGIKHMLKRYKKWNKWILIDAAGVFILLAIIKIIDLINRNRIATNIDRMLARVQLWLSLAGQLADMNVIFILLMTVVGILIILAYYFIVYKRHNPIEKLESHYSRVYQEVPNNPKKYFFLALLLICGVLFIMQFFGKSYYHPSLE